MTTRAQRADSEEAGWQARLAVAVLTHDVIVAGDRMLGGVSRAHESARHRVVSIIDATLASGVPQATIDAELASIRSAASNGDL